MKAFGFIADVVGIISFIPFVFATLFLLGKALRYKKIIKTLKQNRGENPVAIAIGVSGQDIQGQVKAFLIRQKNEMPIRAYVKEGGITPENLQGVLQEIWKIKKDLTDEGVNEVHLFFAGPVSLGIAIGAMLDNWVPVKVYQKNITTGDYEFWTLLHKGFIPGVEKTFKQEILNPAGS